MDPEHKRLCTPESPCFHCKHRASKDTPIERSVRKAEKTIDDFFSTNWGARGLARMSAAEHAEDAMISPNPFD